MIIATDAPAAGFGNSSALDMYRATLNILEDFTAERGRFEDANRATLNLLEDFNQEKVKLEDMQRAVVNILDDFDSEKANVESTNRRLVKEIAAREKTENELRHKTEELIRSNQDVEKFAQRDREIREARDALSKQVEQTTRTNTELEQTLRRLKDTQTQLVQSEKLSSLGAMVAGVAHEINTPVGVGVTAASTLHVFAEKFNQRYQSGELRRSELDRFVEMVMESTQMILRNLQRAADLVQSFKQVAVDQSSGERRQFALKPYIEDVLLSLAPKLKKTAHRIEVDCPDSLYVDSYPGALAQVLINLITNSLIHGFEGRDDGRIHIAVGEAGGLVTLRYSDDGLGIPKQDQSRIFDPFFTTKRGAGGSGLGLHIVYNLVAQILGGTIAVSSEPGRGAEFVIRFPAHLQKAAA